MKRSITIALTALALILAGAALLQPGGTTATAFAGSAATQASLPAELDGEPFPSLAPLVEATKPAVVSIAIARPTRRFRNPFQGDPFFERFFGQPRRQPQQEQEQTLQPTGSGVIVDAERGLVLTNHHVIQNANEIEVKLSDGRYFEASVVGSDAGTDVALLKLPGADELTQMPLGDSEGVRVGDFVLAIGNPFGLSHTVTSGIVSALGRSRVSPAARERGSSPIEDFIQTDASINPGNSGGALVNMRGELVGIPSNILSRSGGNIGIGFAIPTSIAREIMRQLMEFGEIRRGRLGVRVDNVSEETAEALDLDSATGAIVTEVAPESAAEQAGIEAGDVILRVDEEEIENGNDLVNAVGLRSVGEEVTLEVVGNDGNLRSVQATLGGTPLSAGTEVHPALEGAMLMDSQDGAEGVLVESVAPRSAAATNGIEAEDLIFRVNRARVRGVEEMKNAAQDRRLLVLHIQRGNRRFTLTVRS